MSIGTILGLISAFPMFWIADKRGYHYEEILSRSLVVLFMIAVAFFSSCVAATLQLVILGRKSGSATRKLLCVAIIFGISFWYLVPGFIFHAQDRHFFLFSITFPTVIASIIALFVAPRLGELR